MRSPTTLGEYRELVEQALADVDDLRHSAEFDEGEELAVVDSFVDGLEADLTRLRQSLFDGTYGCGDTDLPYMAAIAKVGVFVLPFKPLLELINSVHRWGLAADEG